MLKADLLELCLVSIVYVDLASTTAIHFVSLSLPRFLPQ